MKVATVGLTDLCRREMTVSPAAVLVELQHVVRLLGGLVVSRPRPAAARAHVTKHSRYFVSFNIYK